MPNGLTHRLCKGNGYWAKKVATTQPEDQTLKKVRRRGHL